MDRNERQKLGIRKWVESGCKGTLSYCTGFGKTLTAIKGIKLFLSKNQNKKIIVVVPTEPLKNQWISLLVKEKLFYDVSVQIINTAIKIKEKVSLLVLDEVHRYASDSFIEIFNSKMPTLILGLSATFNRLDGKHTLLENYCPVCDVVTIEEAIKNKWLSPYREYKVLIEVPDINEYNQLTSTFLSAFSIFGNNFKLAMECVSGVKFKNKVIRAAHLVRYEYAKMLCSLSPNDPKYLPTVKSLNSEITAAAFTFNRTLQARKSFIVNHPKKIEITRKILNSRKNKKSITFSPTIKQAEKIGIGYVVHSGKTKSKNKLTIDEFSKLSIGNINTSKKLDEGADIPGLNLAILLSTTSSSTQKIQRIGRAIRYEENKEAEVFTLIIKNTVEEHWFNTANAGKKFIEIVEEDLDIVLNNGVIDKLESVSTESDILFRL